MRVMTRRLLEQQMVVVVASNSGMKDDAMWHVPQGRYLQYGGELKQLHIVYFS